VSSGLANTCISFDETLSEEFGREFKNADAIFLGKVERFDFIKGVPNEFLEKRREVIPGLTWETKFEVFSVDIYWKGISDPEVSILNGLTRNSDGTGSGPSSDEYPFEEGKTYLVFAQRTKGYLMASDCSFTRRDDQIDEILPLLGQGKKPTKPKPENQ
jgi:hypothetical protein